MVRIPRCAGSPNRLHLWRRVTFDSVKPDARLLRELVQAKKVTANAKANRHRHARKDVPLFELRERELVKRDNSAEYSRGPLDSLPTLLFGPSDVCNGALIDRE